MPGPSSSHAPITAAQVSGDEFVPVIEPGVTSGPNAGSGGQNRRMTLPELALYVNAQGEALTADFVLDTVFDNLVEGNANVDISRHADGVRIVISATGGGTSTVTIEEIEDAAAGLIARGMGPGGTVYNDAATPSTLRINSATQGGPSANRPINPIEYTQYWDTDLTTPT